MRRQYRPPHRLDSAGGELRHTQTGKVVSSIRLATNRTIKGEEETQVHTVVWWDRLAELTADDVKIGDPRSVEGPLPYRSFQDEEGKECGVARINAEAVRSFNRRIALAAMVQLAVPTAQSGSAHG